MGTLLSRGYFVNTSAEKFLNPFLTWSNDGKANRCLNSFLNLFLQTIFLSVQCSNLMQNSAIQPPLQCNALAEQPNFPLLFVPLSCNRNISIFTIFFFSLLEWSNLARKLVQGRSLLGPNYFTQSKTSFASSKLWELISHPVYNIHQLHNYKHIFFSSYTKHVIFSMRSLIFAPQC